MKPKTIVGIVLIVLGCIVLAFWGILFTTPGETIRYLGASIETRETHFIPPAAGALALGGGIALLLIGTRR